MNLIDTIKDQLTCKSDLSPEVAAPMIAEKVMEWFFGPLVHVSIPEEVMRGAVGSLGTLLELIRSSPTITPDQRRLVSDALRSIGLSPPQNSGNSAEGTEDAK